MSQSWMRGEESYGELDKFHIGLCPTSERKVGIDPTGTYSQLPPFWMWARSPTPLEPVTGPGLLLHSLAVLT